MVKNTSIQPRTADIFPVMYIAKSWAAEYNKYVVEKLQ